LESQLNAINACKMETRELNRLLRASRSRQLLIENPRGLHHIGAGLRGEISIEIDGTVGYFAGSMIDGPRISITGNAGWFLGDNMTNGHIRVRGHAGNGVGQGMYGGAVIVAEDAGDRAGALMKRGTLIIGGDSGIMTGLYMMGGDVVVSGELGDYAGESMIGGRIFFRGAPPQVGKNAKIMELDDVDRLDLKGFLSEVSLTGINGFKKIVAENPRYFVKASKGVWDVRRERARFRIIMDHGVCTVCGTCEKVCPQQVFKRVKEGYMSPFNDMKCVGCEVCVEYCQARALRVYPVPEVQRATWSRQEIDAIQLKAAKGHPSVRGMGAWGHFPHFDDLVILCAQNSRPPVDHYREPCNTEVTLGGRHAARPIMLKTPLIIGAMSFGAISREAKLASAIAASRIGIAVSTGEGGMIREEREMAPILITQYASGRFGVSADYLQSADAVEIKIGQGAKGGQGGLLMGEKVTEEVAMVRGIPVGSDAVSPARHLDIVGPEDLKMKIEQLREITDWQVPVIVKYSAGRVGDDVKIAAKAGADIIVVDGKQGGTGAAPDIIIEHAGMPTLPALVEAVRALKESGVRDEVNLVISGGIRNGADVAKALALGADAVAMATSVMIAMGCRACGLCATGRCPRGITTQDQALRRRLRVDEAASLVENYLRATTEELEMFTQLAGKTDVRNLERDDLRALSLDSSAITGVKLVGSG